MKNKLLFVGLLILAVVVVLMLFVNFSSPKQVVAKTIEQVRAGKTQELDLSVENEQLIRSIYQSAVANSLSEPKVSLQEDTRTGEQVQVVAFFEMLEYEDDDQVKAAHTGSLIFTLEKSGWRGWKIAKVEKNELHTR